MNIKIKNGERLAIVGRNGSGKTTFIKLLCRLYDPDEGTVKLNGVDIKEYDYKAYLPGFAELMGHSDVQSFTEKYDKDKIVKGMILQNAQDIVMNNAVFK